MYPGSRVRDLGNPTVDFGGPSFEDDFREATAARDDPEELARIDAKQDLETDYASAPGLCERFGLTFPEL